MKIISVKKYKGKTYETELDDGRRIYLHADIIADFGLHSGSEFDRTELKKIIYASNFRRAYQRALYLLDYRDYSYREMLRKLTETYKNEKLCLEVMKKLNDIGIINDSRYAEKLARRMIEVKRYGMRRAVREIMLKGIDRNTAQEALEEYEGLADENLAYLLERKYSRLLTDEHDRKSVEKVKSSLVRYGYDYDEINCAVRNYFESIDTNL